MPNPEVLIFDRAMPPECCAAAWAQKCGATIVPTDRAKDWALPADIAEICAGKSVLYIGTYSKSNVATVKAHARRCEVFVYDARDLDFDEHAVTDVGVFTYVAKNNSYTNEPVKEIFALFDKRQDEALDRRSRAIVQAVKSCKQAQFIDKIAGLFEAEPDVEALVTRGTIELDVCDSISTHWFSQSRRGKFLGHVCRVGHANPIIHDTADLFLREDSGVDVVVVYRVEGDRFRFTVVSRYPDGLSAKQMAERYGGGGKANMAGFPLSLTAGAALLQEILAA